MSWAGTALISRYYAWSRHTNVPMEKRCKEVDSRSRALAICGRLYLGYPGGHNGKIVLLETATDAGHPKLPSEKLWRKGQASKTGNVLIVIATSQPTRLLVTVNRAWHGMSVCGTFYTYPHAHMHTQWLSWGLNLNFYPYLADQPPQGVREVCQDRRLVWDWESSR